jgi:hypothetical protein
MQAKLHVEKSSQGEMLLAFKLLVYTHWCYFSNFWWHNNWTSPKPASEKTQLWDLKSSKLSGGIDSADLKNVPYQDVCSFHNTMHYSFLVKILQCLHYKIPSNKLQQNQQNHVWLRSLTWCWNSLDEQYKKMVSYKQMCHTQKFLQ